MRKSTFFMGFILMLVLIFIGTLIESKSRKAVDYKNVTASKYWVNKLCLTDPALFTEASYIRHLSMADRHAAFQDHPTSLEHFPSGTLIQPPVHLKQ